MPRFIQSTVFNKGIVVMNSFLDQAFLLNHLLASRKQAIVSTERYCDARVLGLKACYGEFLSLFRLKSVEYFQSLQFSFLFNF